MKPERRFVEVRAAPDSRVIEGTAMPWAPREGRGPQGPERFERGAFRLPVDITLTVQHERSAPVARTSSGSLELTDTAEGLTFRATLPETPRADQALADVRAGLLAGASVEFRSLRETRAGAVRVIQSASLEGLALVDFQAYPDALAEVREAAASTSADDWWNRG